MFINKLLIQYLEYLEIEKNRSPKTIENYDHYLRRFLKWADVQKPQEITLDLVRSYRLYLNRLEDEKGHSLSQATQNYHIIALRNFLKYLIKNDIKTLAPEKIEVGKSVSPMVEFLDTEEVERLLESASGEDLKALRDRSILELLFSTGLRISELVSLDRENINLEKQQFSVRGKGRKIRIVFISDSAKKYLKKYLDKRTDIDPALFIRLSASGGNKKNQAQNSLKNYPSSAKNTPSSDDLRLSARSIQRLVKHYTKKAGIVKDVHPHTLRHTFATDLLSAGADIRSVQSLLGHSSITTTQIYTHVTNQRLQEVHQKFHRKNKKQ